MMVLGNNVLQQARIVDPVLDDLVTAHEFGHSGALVHSMVPLNLMYPSVTPGLDDCTDSLDDAQLTMMATTYGLGASAASGALLAGRPAAAPSGSPTGARAVLPPDRLRAMLAGDRQATRSFVEPSSTSRPPPTSRSHSQGAQGGVDAGADQRRGLDREQPGPDDPEGDPPAHARRAC